MASEIRPTSRLTKARAVALQKELLAAYGAPRFQRTLQDLLRSSAKKSSPQLYGQDFWKLVRSAQQDIVERYGFQGTDESLQELVGALEVFSQDPDIALLSNSIDALLFNVHEHLPSQSGQTKASSRREVLNFLRDQLKALQQPELQNRVKCIRSSVCPTADVDKDAIPALAELLLSVQCEILPRYGLEASHEGMALMMSSCEQYSLDPEVQWLHSAVDRCLGIEHAPGQSLRQQILSCIPKGKQEQIRANLPDQPERNQGPGLTKSRASALLSDLLFAYSSRSFQKKLQVLIDRAIAADNKDLSNVPGRQELSLTVQREVLPRYGFEGDAKGVALMTNALQPLLDDFNIQVRVEAVHRKLRIPTEALSADTPSVSTSSGRTQSDRKRNKSQLVELLRDLLAAYRTGSHLKNDEFKNLVRSVQSNILPKHGFSADDSGVNDMMAMTHAMFDDPDVAILAIAVEDVLFQRVGNSAEHSDDTWKLRREQVVGLLREQLDVFSRPQFQDKVKALREAAGKTCADGFFRLAGRSELALEAQRGVLVRYGFEGSSRGACAVLAQCARYCDDAQVAQLIHSTNRKLGMEPAACQRYLEGLKAVLNTHRGTLVQSKPVRSRSSSESLRCGQKRTSAGRQRAASCDSSCYSPVASASMPPSQVPARNNVVPRALLLQPVTTAPATSLPALTKARAMSLFTELQAVLQSKFFKNKLQQLREKYQSREDSVPCVRQFVLSEVLQVLPKYGYLDTEEGIEQMWHGVAPLSSSDGTVKARATTLQLELSGLLGGSPFQAWLELQEEDSRAVDFSSSRAVALLRELLAAYSQPDFQCKLNHLHRTFTPYSEQFGNALTEHTQKVLSEILPRYNFTATRDGALNMLLALSPHLLHPDVQVLAAAVDEALYGLENSSSPLKKRKVLSLLRELLGNFSLPQFQMQVCKRQTDATSQMSNISDLAMTVQCKVLPRYGLDAGRRGVHAMLTYCGHYAFDPEVARHIEAINIKLGVEQLESKRFMTKLLDVQRENLASKGLTSLSE
jgi:hypothetical protein